MDVDFVLVVVVAGCECAGWGVAAGSDGGEEHSFRGYGASGGGIIEHGDKPLGFGVFSCLDGKSALGG